MSSSSTRERAVFGRATPGASRAQTTPLVALIALFAVCTGISLYATTLGAVTPGETTNALAEPTLERVYDEVSEGGVVSPVGLPRDGPATPDGYLVAVAVTAPKGTWTNGRRPPESGSGNGVAPATNVDTAERPVSVATADGNVVWGTLRVWMWR
ncbi:DUF7285 family protein [Halobellus rufus]|uniref:DUF7285 family protein n=1 Tax=Halobellus rufus TaxID=1448860 RepID=UPI00067912B2|nr:hypothetical protein [Halobellus rufus]